MSYMILQLSISLFLKIGDPFCGVLRAPDFGNSNLNSGTQKK